jgi:hypothetical protein
VSEWEVRIRLCDVDSYVLTSGQIVPVGGNYIFVDGTIGTNHEGESGSGLHSSLDAQKSVS